MDLSALDKTLPPGLADAERDMGDKFRAAALSITTLYKSSLSYTKQAYSVGYSACLADVLSTVQSSLTAGQDGNQTLSRLMDWAEAREAAMVAFASDETEDPLPMPLVKGRSVHARQALQNHLSNGPLRPASAPVGERHEVQKKGKDIEEDSMMTRAMLASTHPASASASASASTSTAASASTSTSTSTQTPNHNHRHINSMAYQPTPQHMMSSSPCTPSSSVPRHVLPQPVAIRPAKSIPIRYQPQTSTPASSSSSPSTVPISTHFAPSIPHADIPFVSFSSVNSDIGGISPSQNAPVGSKRPLVENMEMSGIEETGPAGRSASSAGGRSAKRRSMAKDDAESDRRRRRGHGGG